MADNQDSRIQSADILVVDDTIASLQLLTEILSAEGYRVRPADGARVALESALAHPPSLILLDVRMPEMSGFEVCRRLKQDERTRDVPIIFVSALQEVDDRVQGFEVGGMDFISKPFEESEVLARVKTHLQLHFMQFHLAELVTERTAQLTEANEALQTEITERKRAEEALRESEAKFKTIFDHAPLGIAVAEPDSSIVDANSAFLRTIGYTLQELQAMEVANLSPAEDNEREKRFTQEILLGSRDSYAIEKRFKHKDGREVWTDTRSAAVRDENGDVWFAIQIVLDISERKRADEALRESEERYRTLVEQAQDGIAVLQDGKIQFVNSYAARLSGRTVETLLDTPFEAYLTADQLSKAADMFRRRMDSEAVPSIYESAIQHQDGSRVDVEFNAGLTTYEGKPADLVIIRDIRARVKAEQELQAYQRLISLVTDSVPALVSYVDKQQQYRFVNQRYEQAYGVPRMQFIGKHVQEMLGPEGYAAAELHIAAALAGDGVSYEERFDYPDVGPRWMTIDYVPDIDDAGEVQGFIGLINDITARKQAEEALKASEEKFRAVIEQSPVSIQIHGLDGKLLLSNAAYARLYALNDETLKELHLKYDVRTDVQAERRGVLPFIERAYSGQEVLFPPYEYDGVDTLKTLDFENPVSRKCWVQTRGFALKDDGGSVTSVVFMSEDITERKNAESQREGALAALRESEDQLRAIYQAIPVATYTWQRDGDDFILVDYNHMAVRATEGKIDDLIGVKASEAYRDRPEIPQAMARCFSERVVLEEEMDYRFITNGRRRHLNVKYAFAPPDLIVVHTEDITERRQAEQALRRSETHLRRAQEVAHAGSWELDLIRGGLFWSDEIYRIFGLSRETPIDYDTFLNCVLPEDREHVDGSWQVALAGEPYDIEHRIRAGGGVKWVRETAAVEFDQAGRAMRAFGIVQDITGRKLAEQQVIEYQRRLQSLASQLTLAEEQERRRIAADLHDDVGQTLAFARIQLSTAREDTSDPKVAVILDETSDTIRQAIQSTRDLVFDLSSPLLNEIGLDAAVSEWLEERVGKQHGLETEFIGDAQPVSLDDDARAMLFRSVRELLANVVRHAQANKVSVRVERSWAGLRIVVQDDGVGFEADVLPRLSLRKGSFGLFSIQERMSDLGGALEIVSEPGQGCTAILTLPGNTD